MAACPDVGADAQGRQATMPHGVIEQRLFRLFHDIDADDGAAVAAAFAEDGVWVRRVPRIGRDAVLAEMASRPAGRRIEHLVTNILVLRAGEDHVEVAFKALAFADARPRDDVPSPMNLPLALDRYRATLVRIDGVWLFQHLEAERMFASTPVRPRSGS